MTDDDEFAFYEESANVLGEAAELAKRVLDSDPPRINRSEVASLILGAALNFNPSRAPSDCELKAWARLKIVYDGLSISAPMLSSWYEGAEE